MPEGLPPDFDPDRYRAAYPDVALSGLDPAEHYIRFGRIMGRSPSPAPPPAASKAEKTQGSAEVEDVKQAPPPQRPKPIIDRPADFDAKDIQVKPAPPKAGGDAQRRFALAELSDGAPIDELNGLNAYRYLLERESDSGPPPPAADELMNGPARIENAWIAPGRILRLVLSDHAGSRAGWTFRAYQADAAEPGALYLLGDGIELPARGPVLAEFPLRNGLMPLVMELAEAGGAIGAFALMPFPSLLPGGLHAAELRALQPEPNPMRAFWSLSELFLRELHGGTSSPEFSVATLSLATTSEPEDAEAWLAALFRFAPSAAGKLVRPDGGTELTLPSRSVPTISALVSRTPATVGPAATCPFLVADPETFRPRWSVVLPADWDAAGSGPTMQTGEVPAAHVAIAFREQPVPKVPAAAETKKKRAGRKLSVLVDASDPQRAQAVSQELRTAIGGGLDLLANSDLTSAAAEARHPLLLTISDQVSFGDGSALDLLIDMMGDEDVASASCVLLHEVSLKKQKVLQSASGGLFPAAVSFAASPSLSFAEPDVLQALPDTTYPVVANTFHFTLWRTEALRNLSVTSTPISRDGEDVRIGLALAQQGLRSVCTTKCSVRLNHSYTPRDAIDPIGQVRLNPADWERLLSRVTVLRQLF